jgi:hypothetical protein
MRTVEATGAVCVICIASPPSVISPSGVAGEEGSR